MAASTRLSVQNLEDRTVPAIVLPHAEGISLSPTGHFTLIGDERRDTAAV